MKSLNIVASILCLCAFCYTSESIAQSSTILHTQGISQPEITFYNTEGYAISVKEFDFGIDEKGIKKIKKKYSIPKETAVEEDATIPNTKILRSESINKGVAHQSNFYLSLTKRGKMKVVAFTTFCQPVPSIEKEFYEALINDNLPPGICTPMYVDTIQFAGRGIALGPACHWMNVRNIQCPDLGQMNWSEFSDLERAKQMIAAQKTMTANTFLTGIIEEEEIEIIFEGQPITANRCRVKVNLPELVMGGSNILIVYYIAARVRDRYVGCVLSHYTDDVNTNSLPPLLSEVMELKK